MNGGANFTNKAQINTNKTTTSHNQYKKSNTNQYKKSND